MNITELATQVFSLLTIVAQVTAVGLLLCLIFLRKETRKILNFFGQYAILFSFAIALVSTLGSLFYSEIAGYTPCKLCWYQRILMYPQVLILGLAYWMKDKAISIYIMILSALGAGIALYHYLLQRGTIQEIVPCTTVGYSISCAEKFVMTYGYITIPLMALSGFSLIIVLMVIQRKFVNKSL